MTVDAPDSKPGSVCWRAWQSFERQLQESPQNKLSLVASKRSWQSFECQLQQGPQSSQTDSHPTCLCPCCLENRQESTTIPTKNRDPASLPVRQLRKALN